MVGFAKRGNPPPHLFPQESCNCSCQEIAEPTTSVQFHNEHGDNQTWLSKKFNTRTDYSIKLVPIRILSNFKHVEMYREEAREMQSLPEYRGDYVFVEYLIHLMIQEESDDNTILSIPNMAGRIKATAKNLPQRLLVMNYPMPLPGLKMPLTT